MRVDDRRVDPRRVGADKGERSLHQLLRTDGAKAPVEEGLREPRNRERGHRTEHQRLRASDVRAWDRGIDEHQRRRRTGVRRGFDDRDVPAHRVAHQHHRLADHVLDEVMDQRGVRADRRGASGEGRLAEAGEVDGQRAMCVRYSGPDRHPVESVAAEAMDHEDGSTGAAEVDVMNRPVDIGDPMPQCVKDPTPGFPMPIASRSR